MIRVLTFTRHAVGLQNIAFGGELPEGITVVSTIRSSADEVDRVAGQRS